MVERPPSLNEFKKRGKLAEDIRSLEGQKRGEKDPKEIKRIDDLIRKRILESNGKI